MYAISLAGDAELRPLEPWRAAELLARMDRARAHLDLWIPRASRSRDLVSARATAARPTTAAAPWPNASACNWTVSYEHTSPTHGLRQDKEVWSILRHEWHRLRSA